MKRYLVHVISASLFLFFCTAGEADSAKVQPPPWNLTNLVVSAESIGVFQAVVDKEVSGTTRYKMEKSLLGPRHTELLSLKIPDSLKDKEHLLCFLYSGHRGWELVAPEAVKEATKESIKTVRQRIQTRQSYEKQLDIRIQLDKEQFSKQDPVEFLLYIENSSSSIYGVAVNQRMRVGPLTDPYRELLITVQTLGGTPLEIKNASESVPAEREHFGPIPFRAQMLQKIILSDLFDLSKVGSYQVRVSYMNGDSGRRHGYRAWLGRITSKPVTITIVP